MHYVFKSKADADLIMMAPVGDLLLHIVGREPSGQGIIEAAAIPAAIAAIEQAIAAETEAAAAVQRSDAASDGEQRDLRERRIGLAQRAWPLLAMMKRSLAERADIVWGV